MDGGRVDRMSTTARLESLEAVHDFLGAVAAGLSPMDAMRVETAVLEVDGNVVEHRRPADGRPVVTLDVTATRNGDRLDVSVEDDAAPTAAPTATPEDAVMPGGDAESGRGLPLVAALTESFAYERIDRGNRWNLGWSVGQANISSSGTAS